MRPPDETTRTFWFSSGRIMRRAWAPVQPGAGLHTQFVAEPVEAGEVVLLLTELSMFVMSSLRNGDPCPLARRMVLDLASAIDARKSWFQETGEAA